MTIEDMVWVVAGEVPEISSPQIYLDREVGLTVGKLIATQLDDGRYAVLDSRNLCIAIGDDAEQAMMEAYASVVTLMEVSGLEEREIAVETVVL